MPKLNRSMGKQFQLFFRLVCFLQIRKKLQKTRLKSFQSCTAGIAFIFKLAPIQIIRKKLSWKIFVGSKFDIPKVTMVSCMLAFTSSIGNH